MKQYILLLFSFFFADTAFPQNVLMGGTGIPATQAVLEIRSTSRGLLLPRMSLANRLAIPSPAAGLMVFEIPSNRLYKYDGTDWKYVIDNSYWDRNGTNIYNSNDSIGINSFFIDERLHVGGNVQLTSGDLEMFKSTGTSHTSSFDYTGANADGYIQQLSYNYQGFNKGYLRFRNFTTAGEDQLAIGFSATPLWLMKSSGATILNAANPILQLQANGIDKGFLQLSGNDVRIGTNSGNTNGNFVIRTNGVDRFVAEPGGDVGIGIASPIASLHIGGDATVNVNAETTGDATAASIELSSKLVKTTGPAFFNLLPYAHGFYDTNTSTLTCSNSEVTITKFGPGNFWINFPGINTSSIILVKTQVINTQAGTFYGIGGIGVTTQNNSFGGNSTYDIDFSFIIFKP